jgi:hypothetical protein
MKSHVWMVLIINYVYDLNLWYLCHIQVCAVPIRMILFYNLYAT